MIAPGEKVLVLLDSKHTKDHVAAELQAYAPLVSVGSYIVAMDGIMQHLTGAPRSSPDWATNNPAQAAREFASARSDFRLVDPPLPFNEGSITSRVTYSPDSFLKSYRLKVASKLMTMTSASNPIDVGDITAKAAAFNKRIDERVAVGFVPDLRRAVKCEHFYKSFWRDPLFIGLYVGKIVEGYLDLLNRHCGRGLRVLDVGCGAGYVSLELARHGHHVVAIDISASNIEVAKQTLADNPFRDGFGSLRYEHLPFHLAAGSYDVVLFSVSLHHMPDPRAWSRAPGN